MGQDENYQRMQEAQPAPYYPQQQQPQPQQPMYPQQQPLYPQQQNVYPPPQQQNVYPPPQQQAAYPPTNQAIPIAYPIAHANPDPQVVVVQNSGPPELPSPNGVVSVCRAFSYALSQLGCGNAGMGILLCFIPVAGPMILMGWNAEAMRRLVRREAPSIRNFECGEMFSYLQAGFVPWAAQALVGVIVMIPFMILYVVAMIVTFTTIDNCQQGGQCDNNNNDTNMVPVVVVWSVFGVGILAASMFINVILTSLLIRADLCGDVNVAFNRRKVWAMSKSLWGTILGNTILFCIIAIPCIILGLICFYIGVFFVAVALQFAGVHLRWQIYEKWLHLGGEPIEVFPGNAGTVFASQQQLQQWQQQRQPGQQPQQPIPPAGTVIVASSV